MAQSEMFAKRAVILRISLIRRNGPVNEMLNEGLDVFRPSSIMSSVELTQYTPVPHGILSRPVGSTPLRAAFLRTSTTDDPVGVKHRIGVS